MIELRNVSKFYYKKGMITSGISKVDLKLDKGEFVVITGESGSGKSTLLNVISGMDSYEEGEMLIDGRQTSHFMEKELASYRKKYIGNVFQEFNLVGSYTVYQNVELVLLINGAKRSFVKQRTREILEKVGMSEHAGTKVSKLSGGQMQRVAIARALAKETDIIVADEPTGNLDSGSAEEIVKLLREISEDKLVIVVTHNFEQFSEHATRIIKMHDGRIAEDIKVARRERSYSSEPGQTETQEEPKKKIRRAGRQQTGKMSVASKIRLGIRNAFNVAPKFLLMLIVFTFLLTGVTSQYTSYLAQKDESSKLGVNTYFPNLSLDRIVIKKNDGSSFDGADKDAIMSVHNVKSIAEYDVLLDTSVFLEDDELSYDVVPRSIDELDAALSKGKMPETSGEVLIAVSADDMALSGEDTDKLLGRTFEVDADQFGTREKLKVVGIADKKASVTGDGHSEVYMMQEDLDKSLARLYHDNSDITVVIAGREQKVEIGDAAYDLLPCDKVAKGEAIVPPETNGFYDDNNSKGKQIRADISNVYYKSSASFKVKDVYTEKNYQKLTGRDDFEMTNGVIFISREDQQKLFVPDNYQATVYVDETGAIDDTKKALEEMGYSVLPLKDVLIPIISDVMQMIQLPVAIVIVIALFFISYFVIRLIMRSRTGYFGILRMLGMDKRSVKRMVDIELITVMTIAFLLFLAVAAAATFGYIHVEYIRQLIRFMTPAGYGVLYVIMLIMSILLSGKFTAGIFKDSVMDTYREEV